MQIAACSAYRGDMKRHCAANKTEITKIQVQKETNVYNDSNA